MIKKFSLLALIAFFTVSVAMAQQTVTVTEFEGKPIKGIIVNGAFDVRLSQGNESSASVELLAELKDKLTFEYTDDSYVRIGFKDDVTKYLTRSKVKPTATVVVNELQYANVTGASSLIAKGKFTTSTGEFRIVSAGSASLTWIDITCKSAALDVSGNSLLDDIVVKASENAIIKISGTSGGTVDMKCDNLVINASGASKLTLKGKAETLVNITTVGTSSIDMLEFDSPKHLADLSGLSKIKANVSGTSSVKASKTSSYRFTGSGMVTGSGAKRLD